MRTVTDRLNRAGRIRYVALLATLLAPLTACTGGDSLTHPPTNDGKGNLPWELNPNYRALNLAVGEKVQLSVDPKDADGKSIPLTKLPPVKYVVADTSVQIDANGMLTAKAPKATVTINAIMQDVENNWTIRDQIQVRILATPYAFSGFKLLAEGYQYVLDPANPVQPMNKYVYYAGVVTDASGNIIVDGDAKPIAPLLSYQVSVPRREYYVSGGYGYTTNYLTKPTVTASAYIFGKNYKDSATVTVTYPDSAIFYLARQSYSVDPSPTVVAQKELTVLKGGYVNFYQLNTTSPGDDIVFDDQTNVINGNIPKVAGYPGSVVRFPNTGEYTFKSTSIGFTGKIKVVERPTN